MAEQLSIVVPVYCNEATLRELYARLIRTLEPLAREFCLRFVVDASPDGSLDVLEGLGATDQRVHVVQLQQNVGQSLALIRGLAESEGEAMVCLDADLQDPPEAIPSLLKRLGDGVSAVFAGRRGRYQSTMRHLSSRAYKTGLHILSGGRLPRDAGLFVALDREMRDHIVSHTTTHSYLPAVMALSRRRMISIPVQRARNPVAISSYSPVDRMRLGLRGGRSLLGPIAGRTSEPRSASKIGESPPATRHGSMETRRQRPPGYEERTRRQRQYFEKTTKKTMIPRDTPYVAQQVDQLIAFGGLHPDSMILEVGCGMGRYTLPLVRRGFHVEGLDLSPKLLDQLRSYAADQCDFHITLHCADILNPPEELIAGFDAVIGLFTLHHLQDIPGCIAAQVPLLKPGGVMVYLEPNAFNPLYYLQIALMPNITWEGDKGTMQMRPGRIGRAMRAAGLADFTVKRFGFFPPFVRNRLASDRWERFAERVPGLYPFLPFQMFRAVKPLDRAARQRRSPSRSAPGLGVIG